MRRLRLPLATFVLMTSLVGCAASRLRREAVTSDATGPGQTIDDRNLGPGADNEELGEDKKKPHRVTPYSNTQP